MLTYTDIQYHQYHLFSLNVFLIDRDEKLCLQKD